MPVILAVNRKPPHWAAPGDVNAFFGLMLDNVADMLLTIGLLTAVFGFPTSFALNYMIPGTAIGVFVGDLFFFVMALKLSRRTGRKDITAMPLGLDTPSTFGMVFFVLGPAYLAGLGEFNDPTAAAKYTWHIGICAIFISGVFKFACALGSHWVRKVIPRAGLLGSLAAVALVLISFLPLIEILHFPVVGLVALAIILTTLVARVPLPGRVPGALGALLIGGAMYYAMSSTGLLHVSPMGFAPSEALLPTGWLTVFRFEWLGALQDSLQYLPVVIPFALATVVGGIDCTESAAAAGDEFPTNRIIGGEALATLIAALCGGVIQTTPYIGHPAYKSMGGRSAYVLATALFIGGAGVFGYFGYLYAIIPKVAVFPILVFIGLEITAQSFHATPRRHYPAVVLACVPALASLALIFIDNIMGTLLGNPAFQEAGLSYASLGEQLGGEILVVRMLANGFILTSLLWAGMLAALLDHRLKLAALFMLVCAACSLFGLIHSPLPGGPLFLPWQLEESVRELPFRFAAGYAAAAVLVAAWGVWYESTNPPPVDPDELEPIAV